MASQMNLSSQAASEKPTSPSRVSVPEATNSATQTLLYNQSWHFQH